MTYNILLRASAQARDVALVERFFQEMEAAKIHPDLVSYNGVIGAYGKSGDFVQMEKTLFIMRLVKHIKPDTVTSNTLIDSYGRGREFVKMEQVSVLFQGGSIFFPCQNRTSHVYRILDICNVFMKLTRLVGYRYVFVLEICIFLSNSLNFQLLIFELVTSC